MKNCPTCHRAYDDKETCCGVDGSRLISEQAAAPPRQPPATVAREVPLGTSVRTEAPHAHSALVSGDPIERITCEWCQDMNQKTALACWTCGAPLDIKN